MITLLVAAILSASPTTIHIPDTVDLIEVNHYHDQSGRLIINQVIYYDWDPATERHHVVAWRLLRCSGQLPRKDWQRGLYVTRWRDMDVWREVTARQVRETWTQEDPEVVERGLLPVEMRRELSGKLCD